MRRRTEADGEASLTDLEAQQPASIDEKMIPIVALNAWTKVARDGSDEVPRKTRSKLSFSFSFQGKAEGMNNESRDQGAARRAMARLLEGVGPEFFYRNDFATTFSSHTPHAVCQNEKPGHAKRGPGWAKIGRLGRQGVERDGKVGRERREKRDFGERGERGEK